MVSLGRFGRQIMTVKVRPNGSASTIAGAIHYPYVDRVLYSLVAGMACSLVTVDPLFVGGAPFFFAAFWVYENVLSPGRLRSDAETLRASLIEAVDGRPANP